MNKKILDLLAEAERLEEKIRDQEEEIALELEKMGYQDKIG